jgi:hypothetical protein
MKPALRILVLLLLAAQVAPAVDKVVILKRDFVEKYKGRATIDAQFIVDHPHPKPNAPASDGDLHVAGRAQKDVGLPMVAEVVNAGLPAQKRIVGLIHADQGQNSLKPVSGAWRFWFEHPAGQQTQFQPVPVPKNTNPDHSFEIHPVTCYSGECVFASFQDIKGFTPYDADTAFPYYNNLPLTLQATKTAVTLTSHQSHYNYAQFFIRLMGTPVKLQDPPVAGKDGKKHWGYFVLADVENKDGDVLARSIRMIFVAGTPPADAVAQASNGDEFHVLGIPRLNLDAVSSWIKVSKTARATRKLPYEMIIVAVLAK